MSVPFAVPSCSVSPAGGGICSYTNGTTGSYPNLGMDNGYQNYIYAAIPAAGYEFVDFVVTVVSTRDGVTQTNTNRFAGTESGGVWTYAAIDKSGGFGMTYAGYAFWYSSAGGSGNVDAITVVAVFRALPHQPTHLLVNSSTAENPAQIVFDPSTDLLVADF